MNLLSSMEGVTELLTKFAAAPNKSVGRPDLKGALGNLVRSRGTASREPAGFFRALFFSGTC